MKRSALDKAIAAIEQKIRVLELAKAELLKLQAEPRRIRVVKKTEKPAS